MCENCQTDHSNSSLVAENVSDSPAIDCVMPAAGMSSRMGAWKMMLAYRQHTILDESLENALGFCSRVILITGFRSDELHQRYANDNRILVVHNQNYQQGIFSSMQFGAKFVESEHFFISHGDMPCIDASIYRAMWQSCCEQRCSKQVIFPGTERKWGHPALIPKSAITNIITASPTATMKPILKEHGIHFLNMTTEAIHFDVDTPEEYNRLLYKSI